MRPPFSALGSAALLFHVALGAFLLGRGTIRPMATPALADFFLVHGVLNLDGVALVFHLVAVTALEFPLGLVVMAIGTLLVRRLFLVFLVETSL